MSTKKQIIAIVSGMVIFTFWIGYEHKAVYAYHNFYARSASDLAVGTLPDGRLSTSVFVLNLSTYAHLGGFTASGTIIANRFVGDLSGSTISSLPSGIVTSSNTNLTSLPLNIVTSSNTTLTSLPTSIAVSSNIGSGGISGFNLGSQVVIGSHVAQSASLTVGTMTILTGTNANGLEINRTGSASGIWRAIDPNGSTFSNDLTAAAPFSWRFLTNPVGTIQYDTRFIFRGFTTMTISSYNVVISTQLSVTSTGTFTGVSADTGSYILLNSSGMGINGLKYGFPSAACTDGQVWKFDGNNNIRCAADNTGGGGGGATESTITIKLTANGDVATSSSVFEAIPGAVFSTHFASMSILGWELFCTGVSTVSATKVRIAFSTSTDAGTPFTYISTETTIDTNLKWNTYSSSAAKTLNYRESIALHISSSAYTGTPMRGLSLLIRARKGLDNQP